MRPALLGFLPLFAISSCIVTRPEANLLTQREVYLIVTGSGGLIRVGAEGPAGVDPQRVADDILWYLRHDPAFLDWYDKPFAPKGPKDPRGRDYWAAAAAEIKGVEFYLLIYDTIENRDRQVRSLLETTAKETSNSRKSSSAP